MSITILKDGETPKKEFLPKVRKMSHCLPTQNQRYEFVNMALGAMSLWEQYIPDSLMESTIEVLEDSLKEMLGNEENDRIQPV